MKFTLIVILLIVVAIVFAQEEIKEDCLCEIDSCSTTCSIVGDDVICDASKCGQKKREEKENYHDEHEHEHDHEDFDENLIKNGGFENGFSFWTKTGTSYPYASSWEIQTGPTFYSATGLPIPPRGNKAAMIASPTGKASVSLSQNFNVNKFSNCPVVRFDLSFRYFYKNEATSFKPGSLSSSTTQYFTVDILSLSNLGSNLHHIYSTEIGDPQNTSNQYKKFEDFFFYFNGINSVPISQVKLRFAEKASSRLRVGIDSVKVTARCVDLKHN